MRAMLPLVGLLLLSSLAGAGSTNGHAPMARVSLVESSHMLSAASTGSPTNVSVIVDYALNQSQQFSGILNTRIFIPGGAIDPGTTRSTTANLSAPSELTLNYSNWYPNEALPSLTFPSLGDSGPSTIPWTVSFSRGGLLYETTSLTVRSEAELHGNATNYSGGAATQSTVVWSAPGPQPITARAPSGAGPGSPVNASITDLTYTLALWVTLQTARVTDPNGSTQATNITLNLSSGRAVALLAATPGANGSFVVATPLVAESIEVIPAFPSAGEDIALQTIASGGVPPLSYTWSGLPPGCVNNDSAVIHCNVLAAGSWLTDVTLTDAEGVETSNSTWLHVVSVPSPANSPSSTPSGSLSATPFVLAGSLAAVAVVAVWTLRRARGRR